MSAISGTNRRQQGIAAVEFAIISVLMLMIAGGVVEFGRAFWYLDALTKATRDAARYLSESDLASGNIDQAKQMVASSVNAAGIGSNDFTTANVAVNCLNISFTTMGCPVNAGDPEPEYVKVGIVGVTQVIGKWIPILLPSKEATTFSAPFSPSTIMRYMKG